MNRRDFLKVAVAVPVVGRTDLLTNIPYQGWTSYLSTIATTPSGYFVGIKGRTLAASEEERQRINVRIFEGMNDVFTESASRRTADDIRRDIEEIWAPWVAQRKPSDI